MTDFRHGRRRARSAPDKNVDTGAGLERRLAAAQRCRTVFDTDHFRALLETAQSVTGKRLGADDQTDYALRSSPTTPAR